MIYSETDFPLEIKMWNHSSDWKPKFTKL